MRIAPSFHGGSRSLGAGAVPFTATRPAGAAQQISRARRHGVRNGRGRHRCGQSARQRSTAPGNSSDPRRVDRSSTSCNFDAAGQPGGVRRRHRLRRSRERCLGAPVGRPPRRSAGRVHVHRDDHRRCVVHRVDLRRTIVSTPILGARRPTQIELAGCDAAARAPASARSTSPTRASQEVVGAGVDASCSPNTFSAPRLRSQPIQPAAQVVAQPAFTG